AITHGEAADSRPDFDHLADIAITHCQRLIELVADSFDRRHQTVGAHLVDYRLDAIRLLTRLVYQAGFAEIDQHALGTGRNKRAPGADEQMSATHLGGRNLSKL